MFRTQRRIRGLTRIPQWSCFHPRIEAELQADMRAFQASRSFVIAEIVAFHYERIRAAKKAAAREVQHQLADRILGDPDGDDAAAQRERKR